MKIYATFISIATLSSMGFMIQAHANSSAFNHEGLIKGKVTETCYHEPCSVAKIESYRVLNKGYSETKLEVTLLGGSRNWKEKKVSWNRAPHKVIVNCSYTRPTIQSGSQKTLIPLNDEWGVPGVLMSSAELYLYACHNFSGDMTKAINRYGYNVYDE